jgi:tagatose-1,6-bisphosphate aldolase non-catalytic subunit AgaZ/GatZ
MEFKLGFGPMSPLIIDILMSYANSNEQPMMLTTSRNQINHNSGYVMTTKEFANHIKNLKTKYTKICRDHCGPYFLDSEKSLSLDQAIEATKKTIAADIENGFDLIHIDTSRCDTPYPVAEDLIKFSLSLNPNIEFEFGSEENDGVISGVEKYKTDVSFAKQFPNMKFVVAQTGSLIMEDRQIGSFNFEISRDLANYANEAGIKLKEHNADYLTIEQLQLRRLCGVHALNVAPQLGVAQTKTLLLLSKKYALVPTTK